MSLSVIIPALNAGRWLAETLGALRGVDDIVLVDGGSADRTVEIAAACGARVISAPRGRGTQLIAGAMATKGDWLLFLHADTVLENGWRDQAARFMSSGENAERAATFRFAVDDPSPQARRLERLVNWRTRALGLPYGDQALLIRHDFYQSLGGYPPWPIMEDVELVRRIGRRRLVILDARAHTSAERWQRDGWTRRSLRNLVCLTLYMCGMPPRHIVRLYG